MEVAAAETTVSIDTLNTHVSVTPSIITIVMTEATTASANSDNFSYSVTINGNEVDVKGTESVTSTWTFLETTLSISFSSRQTAFVFTGEATTEIAIPPEHTHVTVNGVETAVDLPGLTTTLTVTDSTNVIVQLPETSTELVFAQETYEFAFTYDTISTGNTELGQTAASKYCGTYMLTGGGSEGELCVPALTTIVTLPSAATTSALYLYAPGVTTEFTLPGVTTTFVPERIRSESSKIGGNGQHWYDGRLLSAESFQAERL